MYISTKFRHRKTFYTDVRNIDIKQYFPETITHKSSQKLCYRNNYSEIEIITSLPYVVYKLVCDYRNSFTSS